jgi:hypothetical protein
VQVDDDQDHPAWLCAPVSRRAIRAVLDGHASPHDVLRHSATGTVELVRVAEGRAVPDRCLLCSEVDERLSSPAERRGGAGPSAAGPGVVGSGEPSPTVPGGNTAIVASSASDGPAQAVLAA